MIMTISEGRFASLLGRLYQKVAAFLFSSIQGQVETQDVDA